MSRGGHRIMLLCRRWFGFLRRMNLGKLDWSLRQAQYSARQARPAGRPYLGKLDWSRRARPALRCGAYSLPMSGFSDRWRSNVLSTLTGVDDGRPYWVDKIEQGDDVGYFGPGSAAWVVHGELPTMVAGIRSLLMQALHPGAMAGVHDWSRYQEDALGRLSGTVKWLVTITYADTALARAETARVGRFHDRVRGTYLDKTGTERDYAASDPELLRWVHLVFADSFLACHKLWGGPKI